MSDELVPVDFSQLPSTQIGDDAAYDEIAKGSDFLGRLQLYSKGAAIGKGLIGPGRWGIPEGDDEIVDLGTSIDLLCFARRPKALDMSDSDAIIANYDMNSDEFKRIADASMEQNSGCMYGPSFLVYERSSGRFLEWFCGTKSTRSEAKKVYPFLPLSADQIAARKLNEEPHGPLPFTAKIKFVERKSFSWHVPQVTKCSTPFTNAPSIDATLREVERFIAPQEPQAEKVEGKNRRAR